MQTKCWVGGTAGEHCSMKNAQANWSDWHYLLSVPPFVLTVSCCCNLLLCTIMCDLQRGIPLCVVDKSKAKIPVLWFCIFKYSNLRYAGRKVIEVDSMAPWDMRGDNIPFGNFIPFEVLTQTKRICWFLQRGFIKAKI